MARKKTKLQKKIADQRVITPTVLIDDSGAVSVIKLKESKSKIKSTVFDDSQVSLLYKDLLKTFLVTVIVFSVLLFIFMYMR